MITKLYITAQQALIDFKNDQRGVTAIEYAVLGVAVVAAVTAVFTGTGDGTLQDALNQGMTSIKNALTIASSSASE